MATAATESKQVDTAHGDLGSRQGLSQNRPPATGTVMNLPVSPPPPKFYSPPPLIPPQLPPMTATLDRPALLPSVRDACEGCVRNKSSSKGIGVGPIPAPVPAPSSSPSQRWFPPSATFLEALSTCVTLDCLRAAHQQPRGPAKFNYPHVLIIGFQKAATSSLYV